MKSETAYSFTWYILCLSKYPSANILYQFFPLAQESTLGMDVHTRYIHMSNKQEENMYLIKGRLMRPLKSSLYSWIGVTHKLLHLFTYHL